MLVVGVANFVGETRGGGTCARGWRESSVTGAEQVTIMYLHVVIVQRRNRSRRWGSRLSSR